MADVISPASPSWKERFGPLLFKLFLLAISAAVGAVGTWLSVPPEVVHTTTELVIPAAAESPDGYTPTFGWDRNQDAIDVNLDPVKTTQFDATPAGRALLAADEDECLWRAVRKAAGRAAPWYPNINQENVGCCVGGAFKHVVDVLMATQIVNGKSGRWKPIAVEPSYALSRVEVGGGRISGDGSVGAWIVKGGKDYGVLPMEKVGEHDLSTFSPSRARSWGRTGCPDDLESVAREHPVKGVALVKSAADVERAIRQGYPVIVCSDQGFRMERDATGKCSPQGTWYHAMAIIGVRNLNGKTQFFILNSWGDRAHTGPVVPEDAPPAGFWADGLVVERMVKQGDSFALSDAVGFPARKLNLNIRANPAKELHFVAFRPVPIPFTPFVLRAERLVTQCEAAEMVRFAARHNAWALAP